MAPLGMLSEKMKRAHNRESYRCYAFLHFSIEHIFQSRILVAVSTAAYVKCCINRII